TPKPASGMRRRSGLPVTLGSSGSLHAAVCSLRDAGEQAAAWGGCPGKRTVSIGSAADQEVLAAGSSAAPPLTVRLLDPRICSTSLLLRPALAVEARVDHVVVVPVVPPACR